MDGAVKKGNLLDKIMKSILYNHKIEHPVLSMLNIIAKSLTKAVENIKDICQFVLDYSQEINHAEPRKFYTSMCGYSENLILTFTKIVKSYTVSTNIMAILPDKEIEEAIDDSRGYTFIESMNRSSAWYSPPKDIVDRVSFPRTPPDYYFDPMSNAYFQLNLSLEWDILPGLQYVCSNRNLQS